MPTDPPPDAGTKAARRLAAADTPACDPDAWRALMPAVRAVAGRLRDQGLIAMTQRGRPVDPLAAKGPIRLGLPPEPG